MARIAILCFPLDRWFSATGSRNAGVERDFQSLISFNVCTSRWLHHCSSDTWAKNLGEEQIFDLLCGRCAVYIGLQLEGFIRLAERRGVSIRWSSRKEAAKLAPGKDFFKVDNRTLLHGTGDDKVVLGDGLFVRILFHGTTPESIVAAIERDFEEQTIESPSESETG